jgi:nucleotide-binding universal stress UspA family protein
VFAEIVIARGADPDAAALAELLGRPDAAAAAGSGAFALARDSALLVAPAGRFPRGRHGFVAVAPRGYADRPRRAVRTVGVGYVDSATGRAVLDVARGLAWHFGAEVRAISVVAPSNWRSEDAGAGWRAVAAAGRLHEIPGVRGEVREGLARPELAAAARELDLLVVGSRHHGPLERLAGRDLARRLARRPPCPLLVIPPAD